ncbi:anion exchange protein 2a [Tachysurus ichikawai]
MNSRLDSLSRGHRFEDVPGVRRHLVRKCSKGQVVHISKDHKEPSGRCRKLDRTPHEVSLAPVISPEEVKFFLVSLCCSESEAAHC